MDCSFPGAAYNEKYGSSSTAGSTEKGGLLPILQLLLGSAVIGNGECGRHEMKAGTKSSTDTEVDRSVWCMAHC